MANLYRLMTLMLVGGFCGLATFAAIYAQAPDSFGYNVAEYQRWTFVGAIVGAFAGFGCELVLRLAQRPHVRFSIRELLIAIALLATAIVIIAKLLEWAKFTS
jgi:hypothetical protein